METTYFIDFIDPWVYRDHGSVIAKIYQYHSECAVYNYSYLERAFLIGSGFYNAEYHKFKLELGYEVITLANTAIELGQNTRSMAHSTETSRIFLCEITLVSQASPGFVSPAPERTVARL